MERQRGRTDGETLAQLHTGAILCARNALQNLVAPWIRNRLSDGAKLPVRQFHSSGARLVCAHSGIHSPGIGPVTRCAQTVPVAAAIVKLRDCSFRVS